MENHMTVAIVDDNSLYRKILMRILQLGGVFVVFQAENGMDCMLKMEASQVLPLVLLMDIEMPVMNGFETTRQMKQRWPLLKIIAHSSFVEEEAIKRVIDCGADTFLPKHCSPGELMAAIKQFMHPYNTI